MARSAGRSLRAGIATVISAGTLGLLGSSLACADDTVLAGLPSDLTELSLDQLLRIEVTSVSKRPEPLAAAAAAIHVLTGDEIRRAGVRRLAEALRLVPGLNVAQVDARTYAISARGFNATSADKLQVLLDGRSVYTPLTSAVFWDVLDTYIDDVERIEVIRGPGATLWGANAVNGVINIVTRSAQATHGTVVSGGGGSEERAFAALRTGAAVGRLGSARIYAKAVDSDPTVRADGSDAQDGWRSQGAGFRSDWRTGGAEALTLSGDLYTSRFGAAPSLVDPDGDPTRARGGNLLVRWTHGADAASGWSLQAYYDGYRREIPGVYGERRDTVDLDFQQRLPLGERHALTYGLGYHNSHDRTAGPPDVAIVFLPGSRTLQNPSAFVQDQYSLYDGRLVFTLGSKLEYNDFTGFEVQPGVRVGWQPNEHLFTWAAIARAVRTPNRLDSDIAIFCPPPDGYPGVCGPGLLRVGNPGFRAETLVAYEWGMRLWSRHALSLDLSTFYNDYSDLRSQEQPDQDNPFIRFANNVAAHSYGGELVLGWYPLSSIGVQSWYGLLRIDAQTRAGTDATTAANLEGAAPRHQAGLRVSLQPAERWSVDGFLRYVDELPKDSIPAYTELTLRVAWRPLPALEAALVGRNLVDDAHVEFGSTANRKAIQRAGFIELTWSWQ